MRGELVGLVVAGSTKGDGQREPSEVKEVVRGTGGLAPSEVRATFTQSPISVLFASLTWRRLG